MDTTTLIVIVALFCLIAVASFLVFRRKVQIRIKIPGGAFDLGGEGNHPQGVNVDGVKLRGDANIASSTGDGVYVGKTSADNLTILHTGQDIKTVPPK